jgi:pyrimidine operon attenuation protein / uracil phosphoribosyltransferase
MPRTLLMSPARIRRTIGRLAYEVVERNRGSESLTLFGVQRRGVGLAQRLGETIGEIEGARPSVFPLDVTPFRDDLENRPPVKALQPAPAVEGQNVVLVDDVLFTGRTVRAAIDAVLYYGRPASIQLAVLVDRGHREYPIRPDYVGRHIPTKHAERVVVEAGDVWQVFLEE